MDVHEFAAELVSRMALDQAVRTSSDPGVAQRMGEVDADNTAWLKTALRENGWRKREQWRLLAEGAPDDATADYLHQYFEPTARAIDGLEKALAGLGLLDDALALDLRKPQDYFHRVWSTAFRARDLTAAGAEGGDTNGPPEAG